MEGFKKLPKIQQFKEGGSIQRQVENFTKRDRKSVESADIAQDKKVVKKAVGMHDAQLHDGEKTDLTGLKKGGRAKKAVGTVNKYKKGGAIKKMADGGILETLKNNIMGTPQQNAIARQNEAKYLRAKQLQRASGSSMGPAEQMATGLASAGQQMQPAPTPAPAAMPAPQGVPVPAQKKGGKVKKAC